MNHEIRDIIMELCDYADRNRYTILKIDIDMIEMSITSTICNLQGESFRLHYSGANWRVN